MEFNSDNKKIYTFDYNFKFEFRKSSNISYSYEKEKVSITFYVSDNDSSSIIQLSITKKDIFHCLQISGLKLDRLRCSLGVKPFILSTYMVLFILSTYMVPPRKNKSSIRREGSYEVPRCRTATPLGNTENDNYSVRCRTILQSLWSNRIPFLPSRFSGNWRTAIAPSIEDWSGQWLNQHRLISGYQEDIDWAKTSKWGVVLQC